MSEKQLGPIAIDRLTGQPFKAEPLTRSWTLEELKSTALTLDKPFNPPEENIPRLIADLANGAQVLFTEEEVLQAIDEGLIPVEWKDYLIELVEIKNDTAIIPKGAVEQWRQQQEMRDLVIGRRKPRSLQYPGDRWCH